MFIYANLHVKWGPASPNGLPSLAVTNTKASATLLTVHVSTNLYINIFIFHQCLPTDSYTVSTWIVRNKLEPAPCSITSVQATTSSTSTINALRSVHCPSVLVLLMIYEINHIWTAEMKWKWRNDRRSERNLCNCVKKPEKNSGLQRGLNPWPRDYWCDALPTELWSPWRWEQVNCEFICSYVPVEVPNFFQAS